MANPLAKLTISDKVNEGRKRILTCLAKKGAEEDHVNLLELQKQYFLDFETYLNKDELRRFFSKTHIKQVFESFMPKDIEMTTDVEQTGSLYLKMKRTLDVALADNPLSSKRSTVSKNDTKTLNLVPLPAAKFKTDTGLVRREKTLSCSIWDEQINEKIGKDKDSVMKTNKSTKNQNGVEDLYSSDEHDDMIGLENKDNNDEDEDDDGSDSFGDEALEEGNRLLSSTTKELFKDETNNNNKKIPSNNNIGIRAACHADKYILELQKRKSAATLLDLDKEINNSNKQVSFNEDYEKKRITENVRSRLEFKKLDQLKNKKEPIISSSSAAFGTFKGGKGNSKIKLNNNQRNNFLSTSEDEQEEIEKNNNINYDDEEEGNEDEENGYDEEDNELNLNETKIDFEEDEPVIFMSMPSEGVKNEKIEKKNNLNKDDDLNDFVADEQFYKEAKNNLFNEKKEAASVKQQEIPDHTRLEMIALTSILVRLNVAIKLDALYSELTKYNSTIFASASHFLLFILKNCPINVKIHKCAYNTFLFLWNETPITEDNRKGSLSYLLQKVGKTLEMRQTA